MKAAPTSAVSRLTEFRVGVRQPSWLVLLLVLVFGTSVTFAQNNRRAVLCAQQERRAERAAKTLVGSEIRARGLIDHFFLRACELALLTLVLCALGFGFSPPDCDGSPAPGLV